MDITILIESDGIRAYRTVKSEATIIDGIHRIRWVGARAKNHRDYYSLVHVVTGRALNKVPLTEDEAGRLIDALLDDQIEFHKIDDVATAQKYYVDKLTDEAKRLAGAF
jgi:hypothetical protein